MEELQDTQCKVCTLLLIQNDCETLKKLILKFRDPIFCMEMIPFLALFCRSFQEYAGIELINKDIDSEIYDIRNSLKVYGNRYGKSKKQFLETDEIQNCEFRDMLHLDFAKRLNIHYNIGVFFTKDKKIIGNTQLIADTLNMNGLSEEERSKKSYNLGYNLSSVIGSVSKGLGESLTIPNILMREILPTFYYDDINTNRNSFFKPDIEKDINLFLLHILGNINFVKYVLEPLFLQENTWLFRIKYITVYHAYLGMTKLKNHIVNNHAELIDLINSIALILNTGEILFTSKFRNCMMHYDLKDDGIFAITEGSFDEEKIFFGLIEECFNGESYEQYSNRIDIFRKQMEDLITQQFDMDSVRLKEF